MPTVSKYMHIKVLVGVIIQGLNVNGHDEVGNCSAQYISKQSVLVCSVKPYWG